jgi:hypothetical protein
MSDVTADFLPDPMYHPLPPSVDNILTYAEELDYEGHNITFTWATHEISNHLLNWVRVGLVAAKVRLYRLYKGAYRNFQEFCERKLGLSTWRVGRIVKAATVTIELAKAGFTILPKCEAQASCLVKYSGKELIDAWQTVISSMPEHRITANAIDEALDHPTKPKKSRISVSPDLEMKLRRRALDECKLVEELIEELLDEGSIDEDEADDIEEIDPEAIQRWESDLEELVGERSHQDWLTVVWLKLCVGAAHLKDVCFFAPTG